MSTESLRSISDRPTLTRTQRHLLKNALESGSGDGSASRSQREAIRQLCATSRDAAQSPEQLLVTFKGALVDAANEASLPHGPQRNDLMSRLVSLFIEELYGLRIEQRAREDEACRGTS
jgi:hypothetical protein